MIKNRRPDSKTTRHPHRWATVLLAVAAVLSLSTSVRADDTTNAVRPPTSTDPAVAVYAAEYSVSTEEAARRLDRIEPLHELMATIREAEAERPA
ncbi:MAG: hypothetical protein F4017_04630 [Acidimicrobiaceae bacterium]|nr:hypothetical protein [Acidimicrobiaceae bacterium]